MAVKQCVVTESGQRCTNTAVMEWHAMQQNSRKPAKHPVCQQHATFLRERWGLSLSPLTKAKGALVNAT